MDSKVRVEATRIRAATPPRGRPSRPPSARPVPVPPSTRPDGPATLAAPPPYVAPHYGKSRPWRPGFCRTHYGQWVM
jgi:hypothetical protein